MDKKFNPACNECPKAVDCDANAIAAYIDTVAAEANLETMALILRIRQRRFRSAQNSETFPNENDLSASVTEVNLLQDVVTMTHKDEAKAIGKYNKLTENCPGPKLKKFLWFTLRQCQSQS